MKVLTEDASTRLCAVKCEVSADGDYMGVVLESKSIQKSSNNKQ